MENLITINTTTMPVVEYLGQRVVTLAMIDQVHERPEGTAGRNFREHRQRLVEEEDYFKVCVDEIRRHKTIPLSPMAREDVVFLTEQGYLMLVKSLTDNLAWDVQRQLVNRYFRPAPAPTLPGDYITALEHLLATKRSEQLAIEQRDHAIATKAEIGNRREATAMATASAAMRQVRRLQDDLGQGSRQAAVLAVEKAANRKFGISGYVPLRRWCKARGITAPKVFHPTFGSVRCWPAGAWLDVYGIDLGALFGADEEQA
ncbi:ORF6N domain-containing protein [Pseudomonas typographi]|uniref:ORF6N domain-containing protein n=1 Tax=Pseudomonas typographi TaxID=2715964 RepID=UPI001685EC28|nr:ORF6N domain-containing protein [Pseudomonas typographi]MBD1553601.1 ORF6N domain-containing protein [Pseudomonas typographi]